MVKSSILLPVNEDFQPDYNYMDQYIRNMLIKKYKQYLTYLKNK